MLDLRLKIEKRMQLRRPCARSASSISSLKSRIRSGISLIEILISMFVLLFGLMGVASIFPVGSHMMSEGEKFDSSSLLARNAFEELEVRGMLRPEFWLYSDSVPGRLNWVIERSLPNLGEFTLPVPNPAAAGLGPGHAFVIDPLGTANGLPSDPAVWPWATPSNPNNPWAPPPNALPGNLWPVRRVTFGVPDPNAIYPLVPMGTRVAESIFRLRDDLTLELPEQADQPGVQRWATADPNNTPGDASDDLLLARQYHGNYSWLATVVAATGESLLGLQPADRNYGQFAYDVSVVVFRKRETVPSAASERLVDAVLLAGGDVELFVEGETSSSLLDAALDGFRPGNWMCLMGVNPASQGFQLKWYRVLSLDEEASQVTDNTATVGEFVRRGMLIGPDWPAPGNLRAAILPGAISVVTRQVQMQE